MSHNSHTVLYEIECPICQTVNQFEALDSSSLKETERDSDFSQKEIRWVDSSLDSIHPLLYCVAVCQNCYFASELTDRYKNWKGYPKFTDKINNIKSAHLEKLSEYGSSVKKLGESIDENQFPNQSAIIKIHLAIFDELLCDNPDMHRIGRFYLRIGWLYRFIDTTENKKSEHVEKRLSEIENKLSDFKEKITDGSNKFDELNEDLKNHLEKDEITGKFNSNETVEGDEIVNQLSDLSESYEQLRFSISEFDKKYNDYKDSILNRTPQEIIGEFENSDNGFATFLSKIKSTNDSIVTNESEALKQAVKYFDSSLEGELKTSSHRRLQVLYLVGELSRRINDYDKAKEYFNLTINEGQNLINKNIDDKPRTALPKKILELATEQMQLCNEITANYKAEVI